MDRLASRKLQISEESKVIYEKADEMYNKLVEEITNILATEYLENGKIDPVVSVVRFFKGKGAKGYDPIKDVIVDEVVVSEDENNHVFHCSYDIDGSNAVARFFVEKLKDGKDNSPPAALPKPEEDAILNLRARR